MKICIVLSNLNHRYNQKNLEHTKIRKKKTVCSNILIYHQKEEGEGEKVVLRCTAIELITHSMAQLISRVETFRKGFEISKILGPIH